MVADVPVCSRINWGDFGVSGNNVVLYSALLSTVKSAGQAVDFTSKMPFLHCITWVGANIVGFVVEFWPRTDQTNNVVITVSVA